MMNNAMEKLEALAAGNVDTVLVGTLHDGVTKGAWMYSKSQDCVRIHNGPVICDPLTEGNNFSSDQCVLNGKCLADAKANAARVVVLTAVLEEVGEALRPFRQGKTMRISDDGLYHMIPKEYSEQITEALTTITKALEVCRG